MPFIIYQIYDLSDDYLNYPMDVSVEWFPYKDTENRLSDESIPAITVCYEHIFERILFQEDLRERYQLIIRGIWGNSIDITDDTYIKNLLNYFSFLIIGFTKINNDLKEQIKEKKSKKVLSYNFDVNNRTEFIERQFRLNDKTLNDFNGTQMHFDFFEFIIRCEIDIKSNAFQECNDFRNDIQIISPFGKCHTFFTSMNQNIVFNNYSFNTEKVFNIMESRYIEAIYESMRYFKKKFLIHSYKELPDITTEEIEFTDNSVNQLSDFNIIYKRIDFQKLPKPYETNCYNYGESNRFQCLNECYLKGYNQRWNCTPNDNHLITIQLINGNIEPKVKFCHKLIE